MLWVLKRLPGEGARNRAPYVAKAGQHKSYTNSLRCARVYQSQAAAEADACGNEVAVQVTLNGQTALDLNN